MDDAASGAAEPAKGAREDAAARAEAFRAAHPEVRTLRLAVADLNAIARGKRMGIDRLGAVLEAGGRMPLSVSNLDIWGSDIAGSPLVFETGDADGRVIPTGRLIPMPWLETPAVLVPAMLHEEDGRPFGGDGRQALVRVLERFRARGWTPVVATEMEFYLLARGAEPPRPALSPDTGRPFRSSEILSLRELDAIDGFLTELEAACAAMEVPLQATIAEAGHGQFETDIRHQPDALKAADDAWAFRLAVKGVAARRGMTASFMAKPWPEQPGNGMHMHISVLDESGRNLFDDGSPVGSVWLKQAVAGLLASMPDLALIFLPHRNSWRRMVPGAHAPNAALWGYENRTCAVRIPGGPAEARRIEHRFAGGDVNPWLALAAVLGGMLWGIEHRLDPPPDVRGNAYALEPPPAARLPETWAEAIDRFEASPIARAIFDPLLIRGLVQCKRQELARFEEAGDEADALEFSTYPHRL